MLAKQSVQGSYAPLVKTIQVVQRDRDRDMDTGLAWHMVSLKLCSAEREFHQKAQL